MTKTEEIARRWMWLGHGCSIAVLYGDDGEMQCNHCGLDFKRDDIQRLDLRCREAGLYRAAMYATHAIGAIWTDPRTGMRYPPQRRRKDDYRAEDLGRTDE